MDDSDDETSPPGPRLPQEGDEGVTLGVHSLKSHVVWHEEEHEWLIEWANDRRAWPAVAMTSGLLIRCDVAKEVFGMTLRKSCDRCSR